MRYPRQQADVAALVDNMIGGITENPAIFTHCNAIALQNARNEYALANNALTDAESAMALAAERKLEKFNKLQQEMKKQIKLGVVDTIDNPVELGLIGWGTKREPQQIDIPAQPTELKITAQGDNGLLCLVWSKGRRDGGPIRYFAIERRQLTSGGGNDWIIISTALKNEAKLVKQPTGTKLEYRVKAINSSGESMPSNTVAVVL
jgi:hypothetical protein